MHGMWVIELKHVNPISVSQVTSEPLNTKLIRYITLLREYISTAANEVGGIESGLKVCDDEARRLAVHRLGPFIIVQPVLQFRTRSGTPLGSIFEVILEEGFERGRAVVAGTPCEGTFD